MSQTKIDNSEAYFALSWILDAADEGFFIVAASSHMQRKIARRYGTQRIGIYDFSKIRDGYSYSALDAWTAAQPDDIGVFFLLNMQTALRDEDSMAVFNMSRDLLAKKKKTWIFFMENELEYRLSTYARDIYAYVGQKIFFETEEESEFEGQLILEFEERHNVSEIRKTLERYKELEVRYMALSLEDTPDNQLLSAAVALLNIAALYRDCARYNDALTVLKKTKEIREYVLGKEHPDTATTYSEIAVVHDDQGDDLKALDWYHKALDIAVKVLGKEHPDIAAIYNNIAKVYDNQGDDPKALDWYHKALDIAVKVLGKEHPNTATICNNIAVVYRSQGDYSRALDWCLKSLDVREKLLGKEHPDTATIYDNIALVYSNQGDYSKALEWHQKALEIFEKVLGKEHPNTATVYNNIAIVYKNQGDHPKALNWYQKAYEILLHKLGENHPSTKTVKNNMQTIPEEFVRH